MTQSRSFSADPESVAAARRFAANALADAPPDTLESVTLMVSELATNCIRHTRTAFELSIARTTEEIRVEVTDEAAGMPRMRSPAVTEPTGRGLQIVNLLSESWGVRHGTAPGKTVWFTVAVASELVGSEREPGAAEDWEDPDEMATVRQCVRRPWWLRRVRLAPAWAGCRF